MEWVERGSRGNSSLYLERITNNNEDIYPFLFLCAESLDLLPIYTLLLLYSKTRHEQRPGGGHAPRLPASHSGFGGANVLRVRVLLLLVRRERESSDNMVKRNKIIRI